MYITNKHLNNNSVLEHSYEDRLRIESIRAEKKKETELRVAEERRKSELALLRHELTEQMNRAIQETRQNMIMRTLLRRRMSNTPESELLPERGTSSSPRGNSQQFTKFERDTLKTWEQVVRRMLRSTITNNRSLYGAHIGSHEDGDFHEAFRAFDRDGNGRISLSELADAFRRLDLGMYSCSNLIVRMTHIVSKKKKTTTHRPE